MRGNSTSTDESVLRPSAASDRSAGEFGLVPVAAQGGAVESIDLDRAVWTARGRATIEARGRCLLVRGDDELAPTVATEQPVRDRDLRRYTSLTATVRPDVRTDAGVRFRLRLAHDAGSATRRSRGPRRGTRSSRRARPLLSSRTFVSDGGTPLRLHWDLSGIDDRVLDSARQLELVCERADRPVSEGPYGRRAAGVRGTVTLSEVAFSDSPDPLVAARLQNDWQRLESAAGAYEETVVRTRTGDAESGTFRFADGAVDYDFCVHADGTHVLELGDSVYRFRDGMGGVDRR